MLEHLQKNPALSAQSLAQIISSAIGQSGPHITTTSALNMHTPFLPSTGNQPTTSVSSASPLVLESPRSLTALRSTIAELSANHITLTAASAATRGGGVGVDGVWLAAMLRAAGHVISDDSFQNSVPSTTVSAEGTSIQVSYHVFVFICTFRHVSGFFCFSTIDIET